MSARSGCATRTASATGTRAASRWADILTRARSVAGRLDERTTLIVAHAGINRVLVAVLAGLEARLNDLYQPHDVIYHIGRAAAPPVVTHLHDGAEHPGPYIAGWS